MKRFKNIALVHGPDTSTREWAARLARDHRARLTLVHPVPALEAEGKVTVGDRTIDVEALVRSELEEDLARAATTVRALGVRPGRRVLVGEPFVEVIKDVEAHARDLVVLTAEGRTGLRERLFGSLSTHLMRKCPVPLLVLKPGRAPRMRRVLAAIDPDRRGHEHDAFNREILALAASFAARDGAELHVLHAWTLYGESLLRNRGGLSSREVQMLAREEAETRRAAVQELLDELELVQAQVHVVKGEPSERIRRAADELAADLLVMGTVCRTGLPGFFIGNTAERVLGTVDASVLVVKPEGFRSPVLGSAPRPAARSRRTARS